MESRYSDSGGSRLPAYRIRLNARDFSEPPQVYNLTRNAQCPRCGAPVGDSAFQKDKPSYELSRSYM